MCIYASFSKLLDTVICCVCKRLTSLHGCCNEPRARNTIFMWSFQNQDHQPAETKDCHKDCYNKESIERATGPTGLQCASQNKLEMVLAGQLNQGL